MLIHKKIAFDIYIRKNKPNSARIKLLQADNILCCLQRDSNTHHSDSHIASSKDNLTRSSIKIWLQCYLVQ